MAFRMNSGTPFFTAWRLAWIAVFVLSLAMYWPSLRGQAVWDDHHLMDSSIYGTVGFWRAISNPFLGVYFRPLTSATYWMDSHFSGAVPMLWHQTNLLLHAMAALAVMWLAYAATQKRVVTVIAGVIFAVHPSQVAAVAWIGGRTDCQAALFAAIFFASLISYLQTGRKWLLWLGVVAFLFAALTKEQTALLVFGAPLAERVFGTPSRQRLMKVSVVFGVAAAAYAATVVLFLPRVSHMARPDAEAWVHRLLVTPLHYLGLALIPTRPGLVAVSLANYEGIGWALLGAAIYVATVGLALISGRKDQMLGWLWSVIGLAYIPVSNLIPVPSLVVGPYRLAVAGVFISVLLAIGLERLWIWRRWVCIGVASSYGTILMVTSVWAIAQWNNDLTLFTTLIRYDPWSSVGITNAVTTDLSERQFGGARGKLESYLDWAYDGPMWKEAVRRGAKLTLPARVSWRVQSNVGSGVEAPFVIAGMVDLLGQLCRAQGDVAGALRCFESAYATDPTAAGCAVNLAKALERSDQARADQLFERAASLEASAGNCYLLGLVRERQRRYGEAANLFRAAAGHTRWMGDYWVELAKCQFALGDRAAAGQSLMTARQGLLANRIGAAELDRKLIEPPAHPHATLP